MAAEICRRDYWLVNRAPLQTWPRLSILNKISRTRHPSFSLSIHIWTGRPWICHPGWSVLEQATPSGEEQDLPNCDSSTFHFWTGRPEYKLYILSSGVYTYISRYNVHQRKKYLTTCCCLLLMISMFSAFLDICMHHSFTMSFWEYFFLPTLS